MLSGYKHSRGSPGPCSLFSSSRFTFLFPLILYGQVNEMRGEEKENGKASEASCLPPLQSFLFYSSWLANPVEHVGLGRQERIKGREAVTPFLLDFISLYMA